MSTVRQYLTDRLHIDPQRADDHLRRSYVRVDQEVVTDGSREWVEGEKVVLAAPPVTEEGAD